MTLRQQPIERHMRPFDHIRCPVCGGSEFVELTPAGGVWCNECNARFSCRDTTGDPGLVVDCHIEHIYQQHRERVIRLVTRFGRCTYLDDFGRVDSFLESLRGKPIPVYFYQVCKEPQEDGSWSDQRSWILTNLDARLKLWEYVSPPSKAKVAS